MSLHLICHRLPRRVSTCLPIVTLSMTIRTIRGILALALVSAVQLLYVEAVYAQSSYYVRAGATGANNGSDWTNAYPSLPTSLIRGATYYVAGGSYGQRTFGDPVSGTTQITIRKATVSDHGTNVGWQDSYGNAQAQFGNLTFRTGYYTFDGVTGGGPGSWETGLGFKVQGTTHTIDFPAVVSNIAIRHTDIQGGGRSASTETDLIYLVNKYSNISISYCFLHDVSRTMILTWPANGSGFLIEYSKFARNGNAEHREAWSAGTDSNVIVRYNLFEDIMGTGFIAIVNSTGTASNWEIYGNVFYWTGKYTDGVINSGAIVTRYDPSCPGSGICVSTANWKVYNNVIANVNTGGSSGPKDVAIGQYAGNCANGNSIAVVNNIWYSNGTSSTGTKLCTTSATNTTSGGNPFNDSAPWSTGNWALASGSAAMNSGTALDAAYATDMLGNRRGADGLWDRGSLEYVSGGGGGVSVLGAPTNLRITP